MTSLQQQKSPSPPARQAPSAATAPVQARASKAGQYDATNIPVTKEIKAATDRITSTIKAASPATASTLYQDLAKQTPTIREQIRSNYNRSNNSSLDSDLQKSLSPKEYKLIKSLLTASRTEPDAKFARQILTGRSTKEASNLISLLRNRSSEEIALIKGHYQAQSNAPMERDIIKSLSGASRREALALLRHDTNRHGHNLRADSIAVKDGLLKCKPARPREILEQRSSSETKEIAAAVTKNGTVPVKAFFDRCFETLQKTQIAGQWLNSNIVTDMIRIKGMLSLDASIIRAADLKSSLSDSARATKALRQLAQKCSGSELDSALNSFTKEFGKDYLSEAKRVLPRQGALELERLISKLSTNQEQLTKSFQPTLLTIALAATTTPSRKPEERDFLARKHEESLSLAEPALRPKRIVRHQVYRDKFGNFIESKVVNEGAIFGQDGEITENVFEEYYEQDSLFDGDKDDRPTISSILFSSGGTKRLLNQTVKSALTPKAGRWIKRLLIAALCVIFLTYLRG